MIRHISLSLLCFAPLLNAAAATTSVQHVLATQLPKDIQISFQRINLTKEGIVAPGDLRHVGIFHQGEDFFAVVDGKEVLIQRCYLHKDLRCMSDKDVIDFLDNNGYVKLSQLSNGEYALDMQIRVDGGKWLAGKICKYTVKGICWLGVGFFLKKTAENTVEHASTPQVGTAQVGVGVFTANAAKAGEKAKAAIDAAGEVAERIGNMVPWF